MFPHGDLCLYDEVLMARRTGNVEIEIKGLNEFIRKLDKLDADVPRMTREAIEECGDIAYNKLKELGFIRYKNRSGLTHKALNPMVITSDDGHNITASVGYDYKAPHGLVSIFLNYGSPTTSPGAYFIQEAREETIVPMEDVFKRKLQEAIKRSGM